MMCRLIIVFILLFSGFTVKSQKTNKFRTKDLRLLQTSDTTYHIKLNSKVKNQYVKISNTGNNIIINPRLIVNGKRNWYSIEHILSEILEEGMSDREKALAIWSFVVENRINDYPAHKGIELHDPVRFFNVYGYGYCDDAATNLMVLAQSAGMRARVWGLNGHVVPEIYFEGDWRVLDADAEVYYLEDDGYNIAGVKTLKKRRDIILNHRSPYYYRNRRLARYYLSTHDNSISEWYNNVSEVRHAMSYILRPGESIIRFHNKRKVYFFSHYNKRPKLYSNGVFIFEPVFRNNTFMRGAESVKNILSECTDDGCFLYSTGEEGSMVYYFSSPYPLLIGNIHIGGKASVSLYFSEMGNEWSEIVSYKNLESPKEISLRKHLRNGKDSPVYNYYIKLSFDGIIDNLRFENIFQCAPKSLPTLDKGVNVVRYYDENIDNIKVEIEYGIK